MVPDSGGIKSAIFTLYFLLELLTLFFRVKRSVPILCYRNISPVCGIMPGELREHLRWLYKNGYRTIGLKQLLDHLKGEQDAPEGAFVLTFEDCYLDNWVHAIPILKEFGAHAAFGCVTGYLHDLDPRPNAAIPNTNLKDLPMAREAWSMALEKNDYSAFMSRAEIRLLAEEYGHEVFGHTHTHQMCFRSDRQIGEVDEEIHPGVHGIYPDVRSGLPVYARGSAYAYDGFWPESNNLLETKLAARTTDERIEFCLSEFMLCRERLESLLAQPIGVMSWPWGEYDDVAIRAALLAGYEAALSFDRGANIPGTPLFAIRRLSIQSGTSTKELGHAIRWMNHPLLARLSQKTFHLNKDR